MSRSKVNKFIFWQRFVISQVNRCKIILVEEQTMSARKSTIITKYCKILTIWKVNYFFYVLITRCQPVLRIRSFLVTRIRIWENTGSGSFIHKKTPCYSNFLVIKLSKIHFRPNNLLSLILSVIGCLDLVRKCHKKYLFC